MDWKVRLASWRSKPCHTCSWCISALCTYFCPSLIRLYRFCVETSRARRWTDEFHSQYGLHCRSVENYLTSISWNVRRRLIRISFLWLSMIFSFDRARRLCSNGYRHKRALRRGNEARSYILRTVQRRASGHWLNHMLSFGSEAVPS